MKKLLLLILVGCSTPEPQIPKLDVKEMWTQCSEICHGKIREFNAKSSGELYCACVSKY